MSGSSSATTVTPPWTSLLGRSQTGPGTYTLDGTGQPIEDSTAQPGSYSMMQTRIGYEVEDAVQVNDIQNAIVDAIRIYERNRYWFNELLDDGSCSTIQGQEFYSGDQWQPIATMPHIDTLSVLAFGSRYTLTPRTQQQMEERSINPQWQGMPMDWSVVGGMIRLYPIPDNAYPLRMLGTYRFTPLANPTDTNAWLVEGERLIRTEAKRLLYLHVLRDFPMAQAMQVEAARHEMDLAAETQSRMPGGTRIRARRF